MPFIVIPHLLEDFALDAIQEGVDGVVVKEKRATVWEDLRGELQLAISLYENGFAFLNVDGKSFVTEEVRLSQ